MSRAIRRKLALPNDSKGAVVVSVIPGGPAATAGIQANDVVEQIGDARLGNDCDFAHQAFRRSCQPVKMRMRRGLDIVEVTLVPVDEGPFLDKACAGGNLDGCFRGAWLLWSRDNPTPHVLELFTSACTAGSAEACAYEGLILSETTERTSEAVPVLERACELDSGAGCAHLAFLYAAGRSVAKNDKRAAALYRKSCELGDAQGCYNVGLMAGEGRGLRQDAAQAAADYDEACELGSSTACTNLGFLYEKVGNVRDRSRALALYQRGCDGSSCQPSNLGGCVNVGRAYRDGIGVEKDEERAAAIFRDACYRKPNRDDVHSDENGGRACSLLGGLYLSGGGIEKDLTQGRELSELGCQRGDGFGCFNAAVVYAGGSGVAVDLVKAAEYYDLACKDGDGEGCHELAAAYAKGKGVARDARLAKTLDQKACELGFAPACGKKKKR